MNSGSKSEADIIKEQDEEIDDTSPTSSPSTSPTKHTETPENNNNTNSDNQSKNSSGNNKSSTQSSSEKKAPQKNVNRRVKIFMLLGHSGKWLDHGTGYISCEHIQEKKGMCIKVVSDKNEKELMLQSKIPNDDIFAIQDGTIIAWTDTEAPNEIALSFQTPAGCCEIWDEIRIIQGKKPDSKEQFTKSTQKAEKEESSQENPEVTLPRPTLSSLESILAICEKPEHKEAVLERLCQESYIEELLSVFKTAEEIENTSKLRILCKIVRFGILSGDSESLDVLLSKKNLPRLLAIFEYDPEMPCKIEHRKYLEEIVQHKIVMNLTPSFIELMKHTFQIQYLKDTVLPKWLDDQVFSKVSAMLVANQDQILTGILKEKEQLKGLMQEISSIDEKSILETLQKEKKGKKDENLEKKLERKRDLMLFFLEIFHFVKSIKDVQEIPNVLGILFELDIFSIVEKTLDSRDVVTRRCSAEIVCLLISFGSAKFINYIVSKFRTTNECLLFRNFILRITNESELGIQENVFETLIELFKTLEDDEHAEFLELMYSKYFHLFLEPLNASEPKKPEPPKFLTEKSQEKPEKSEKSEKQQKIQKKNKLKYSRFLKKLSEHENLCEILLQSKIHSIQAISQAVESHQFRSRSCVLKNNVISKLSTTLGAPQVPKELILCIVQFFRNCLKCSDILYDNYFIRHQIFDSVMKVWEENKNKNNLINSAIIDLFETIRSKKRKKLAQHLAENYNSQFENVNYIETFSAILKCAKEGFPNSPSSVTSLLNSSPSSILSSSPKKSPTSSLIDDNDNISNRKGLNLNLNLNLNGIDLDNLGPSCSAGSGLLSNDNLHDELEDDDDDDEDFDPKNEKSPKKEINAHVSLLEESSSSSDEDEEEFLVTPLSSSTTAKASKSVSIFDYFGTSTNKENKEKSSKHEEIDDEDEEIEDKDIAKLSFPSLLPSSSSKKSKIDPFDFTAFGEDKEKKNSSSSSSNLEKQNEDDEADMFCLSNFKENDLASSKQQQKKKSTIFTFNSNRTKKLGTLNFVGTNNKSTSSSSSKDEEKDKDKEGSSGQKRLFSSFSLSGIAPASRILEVGPNSALPGKVSSSSSSSEEEEDVKKKEKESSEEPALKKQKLENQENIEKETKTT